MKVFKKAIIAAAALTISFLNVCYGSTQPLIGSINTASAETYSDVMQYEVYFSYKKVDKDGNGTYDYIRPPRKLISGFKINDSTNQIQTQAVTHSAVTVGIFHNFKNLDLRIDVFNENTFM